MKNEHPQNLSSEDQGLIDQISEVYHPPQMSNQEARAFETHLMRSVDEPRSGVNWRLSLAIAILLIGLGFMFSTTRTTQPDQKKMVAGKEAQADLAWVASWMGIDEEIDDSEDLPEEYATMMLMMDEYSEDWDEF